MPERGFATETWDSDEWFQDLLRDQRYLFIYLWTNSHCNPAGLYYITLTTIANEAKFSREELPALLKSLAPKVQWYPESNLIWVKNFIKRQSKSSKFLAAAAKCLVSINQNGVIQELLDYNLARYSISIPYQYYMDRILILTRASSDTDTITGTGAGTEEEGIVKGQEVSRGKSPASKSETAEKSLSPGDHALISVWRSVKGWNVPDSAAAELMARLRTEFPEVDLLAQSKTWAAGKLSDPLLTSSRPTRQLWRWMENAHNWGGRNAGQSISRGRASTGGEFGKQPKTKPAKSITVIDGETGESEVIG